MLKKIRTRLAGEQIAANELGWRAERFPRGMIIRPPSSIAAYFKPLAPFLLNTIAVIAYAVARSERVTVAACVLPASLILGVYAFRDAALYINRQRKTVMLGNFRWFALAEVAFEAAPGQTCRVEVRSQRLREPVVVWESANEAEANEIRDLLSAEISGPAHG